MESINLFWFRRDLRIEDNCGLYHSLKNNKNIFPIFIFDENILNYIKKWIPNYNSKNYIEPIVNHKAARELCLKTYKEELN